MEAADYRVNAVGAVLDCDRRDAGEEGDIVATVGEQNG